MLSMLTASAQENKASWINNVKLSGYVLTRYKYSDPNSVKDNTFELRMARLALEGRIMNDFYWKTQIQFNGNTSSLGQSPRVVDLFVEWQKYKFARIKFGQFKRAFTFENPMNPIDQGFPSYAQNISALAGFNDRAGEHASNGRDIGVQLQGDVLPNAKGRSLVHYQVGVYNGQGINVTDVDNKKDVIGGLWVMPIEGMRLGAFGWEGTYARKGTWTDADGANHSGVRSLRQHRYAFSAEYAHNDWTLRSEYIHSTGYAFKQALGKTSDNLTDCNLGSLGNKAQGVYALVIAPVIPKTLHVKARYDMYQPSGDWSTAKTQYELGADYEFTRNMELSMVYSRVNDRSLEKHNYNKVEVAVDWRF